MVRCCRSHDSLQKHFNRYLLIGGFPELALSGDAVFAQRILREDVTDRVIKRDITALFGTRNVLELEKIFLYLCIHSGNIITQDSIAKEIQVSRHTVSHYIGLLEQANLVYISNPVEIGGKKILKTRPKIYIADAALRNSILVFDETILFDPNEMGVIIETAVYKHIASFYYPVLPKVGYYRGGKKGKEIDIVVSLPRGRILIEVKYRNDPSLEAGDAIVEQADEPETLGAIVVTKAAGDFGAVPFPTPIVKIPAFAFLYLLGHAERISRAETRSPLE